MPEVSVIIVNWNTEDLLAACLESVYAERESVELEVIVVDNGSSDGSVGMVRDRFPDVRLRQNATNEKFAKPSNDGMRMATGSYFLLLNSDVEVTKGTIQALKTYMDHHPETGVGGPMLLYPDGRLQRSVSANHTLWTHVCDMLLLDKVFPKSRFFAGGVMATYPYDENATQEVETIMGAAFMVRRDVTEQTGMFDENLSIYYNEQDWFRRIRSNGWNIAYIHDARVVHHHGVTTKLANVNLELVEEMYENVSWYYYKHYGRLGAIFYRLMLTVGFLPRTIGWALSSAIHPTDRSRSMLAFSLKTLSIAAVFWTRPRGGATSR
ncbi:MAG: glycosyltransferase family 2 protein [Bacteroidota bacterium]